MKNSITIDYWIDTSDCETLTEEQTESLDLQCKQRAFDMIIKGYYQGELCCTVPNTPEEIDVRGWWKSSKQSE